MQGNVFMCSYSTFTCSTFIAICLLKCWLNFLYCRYLVHLLINHFLFTGTGCPFPAVSAINSISPKSHSFPHVEKQGNDVLMGCFPLSLYTLRDFLLLPVDSFSWYFFQGLLLAVRLRLTFMAIFGNATDAIELGDAVFR